VGIPVFLTVNSKIIGKDGSGKDIGTEEERTEESEIAEERGKKEMFSLSARGTAIRKMT